jgi:HJR/Mrr/RecB family endonuclease
LEKIINNVHLQSLNEKENLKDIEEIISIKNEITKLEITKKFLEDIGKFNKLFEKKGILIDPKTLLIVFITRLYDIIQNLVDQEYHSIFSKLKKDSLPPLETVIKEIFSYEERELLDNEIFLELSFNAMPNVLKSYGYSCDQDEIQNIMSKIFENIEIDEFEKNLFSNSIDSDDQSEEFENQFSTDNITGFEFEQLLEKFFTRDGYDVLLTRKTGDQGADLVISKNGEVTVIQAKCYSEQSVGNSAIQEVVAAKNLYKGNKAMVIATTTFTRSAIELAEVNNVELWDGNILSKKFEELKMDTKNAR